MPIRFAPTVLILVYALILPSQVQVWQSEPTLWTHAVHYAPHKPRPAINRARALILSGQFDQAERWLYRAMVLADAPHVPYYDRDDAVRAATSNLQTVSIVRAVFQPAGS